MATARQKLTLCALAVLALAASACTQLADPEVPQTTVFPSSDIGGLIQGLYSLIFWMALVVFIGVEAFLVYAALRFRRRPLDNLIPAQIHGNTRLEIAWTIIPSVVLLIIAIPTIQRIFEMDRVPTASAAGGEPLRVEVIGHQWWWEFRYPDLGPDVVTANEVHLPLGRAAFFELRSADVIHSFWFPKMGAKMDVVPTRVNHMWFTPQETGEFYGQCFEFCGLQHANMRDRLVVESPADFDRWVGQQRAAAVTPTGSQATRGAALFQSAPCAGCHTIRGTNAKGTVGPDLTHVGARTTIAAGVLNNNLDNLSHWIADPQAIKPGSKMPTLGLPATDVSLLAVYLQSLK
jgi:cytochrome c oxidase subunit II